MPSRFGQIVLEAAEILEPKARRATPPSSTLKTEEDVDQWIAQTSASLKEPSVSKIMPHVGPTPTMDLEFGNRLNLLTGDNGLGKSFQIGVVMNQPLPAGIQLEPYYVQSRTGTAENRHEAS